MKILSFLLTSVLFVSLTACQRDPQVRKQKFYSKGVELMKKGQVQEARLQFLNALQVDAKYAEAASALAEIEFHTRNYSRAYSLLQQAVAAKPELADAHKGLAQLYRLSGRNAEAQKELELVLDRDPNDIAALMSLGAVQHQQRQYKDAAGTFNHVLELQPGHAAALVALATISRDLKDIPATEQFLKLAQNKNPSSVPVRLALFKLYITTGRTKELEAAFQQALRDTGNNVQILEAQAGYYEGANRLDEAENLVKQIQVSHGNEAGFRDVLADFYIRTNNWNKAKTELERLIQQHKDAVDERHKLIEVHLNMNARQAAEALNNSLLQQNPKDSYAHLLKGRVALTDGNAAGAVQEFAEAQKYRPEWPAAHFWMAQAKLRQNQAEQAQQELNTALKYDPEYRAARLTLAGIQNHTGHPDVARANILPLLKTNPRDIPALLVYSESLIYDKHYDQAEKVLKSAAAANPNIADLHRQLGLLNLAKRNMAAARNEFHQAWVLNPSSKPLLQDVMMGYAVDNQTAAGIDFLKKILTTRQDAFLQIELARMYAMRGQTSEAISGLQAVMRQEPSNPESDIVLAGIYVAGNQGDQAAGVLAQAVRKSGINADLLVRAGGLYERLQRWGEARDVYQRAIQSDPGNAIAKNNLAWVLVDHGGDLNQALSLARDAKAQMADSPEFASTLGWVYYRQQQYPQALKLLEESTGKDPSNATFRYQLGMIQWKLGHNAEARQLLAKALQLDPKFPEAASATSTLAQIPR